jgi:hypothetical protein
VIILAIWEERTEVQNNELAGTNSGRGSGGLKKKGGKASRKPANLYDGKEQRCRGSGERSTFGREKVEWWIVGTEADGGKSEAQW